MRKKEVDLRGANHGGSLVFVLGNLSTETEISCKQKPSPVNRRMIKTNITNVDQLTQFNGAIHAQ